MSMGKQEAFEIFKRDYSGNSEIEEQKKFLKNSYAEAKLLGEVINSARTKLSNLLVHFSCFCLTLLKLFKKSNSEIKK